MDEEPGAIRKLDETTVERIAAGEVVERPASVVKELVENSLDAGADAVEVAVAAGGTEGIRVSDDGHGMTEADLRQAVREHTTSKIRDVADLQAGVGTLGFRGEALHAIGAVSRLTIRSRPPGADRGTELRVEGGEVTAVEPAGCPAGTTVEVTDLFYNVPARRKYLAQDGTEFAHVNTVVTGYALANPDTRVRLKHDGRETFATTGDGDLRSAVMAVYGREVAEAMVPVGAGDPAAADLPEDAPEGPLTGVSGLVSHPETNRASNDYLATYVDGRYVRSAVVRDAVVDAYGTQLAPDRYPFAVLFLSVPGDAVDVNVHPRKTEVRFADAEGVERQVRAAVESALLEAGVLRSSAPRGRSAPEQTAVEPGSEGGTAGERAPSGTTGDGPSPDEASPGDRSVPHSPGCGAGATDAVPEPAGKRGQAGDAGDQEVTATSERAESRDPHDARRFRPGSEQTRLVDAEPAAAPASFDRLPAMRVLGQYDDTYLVAETDDGLVLVDQHAADERVAFERLRERLTGGTETQALAAPVELSVTAREAELFESYADALARVGFRAERTGERAVTVRTVPDLVAEAADPELVREVLSALVRGEAAAAETVEAAADDLLADLACYPAITGNTSLTEGSARDLLAALDDCENPWACPHGRPVVVELARDEIEARFERDYPGHGGRRQ
ncbi:MAG: DNA mismatch repair endonuclease MutL [Halorientalis sp.]